MAHRMSEKQVRTRKEELRKERGDRCQAGITCNHISGEVYRIKFGEDFLLDHIDNNPFNNDPINHQLICRSCNSAKNPRGKSRFHSEKYIKRVRARERGMRSVQAYAEVDRVGKSLTYEQQRGMEGERQFVAWVKKKISANGYWPLEDTINAGAQKVGMSIQATTRWSKKLLSSEGAYATFTMPDGIVVVILKGKPPKVGMVGEEETDCV